MPQGSGKWYEMQDLHVADILPQMITLSESYVQVSTFSSSVLAAFQSSFSILRSPPSSQASFVPAHLPYPTLLYPILCLSLCPSLKGN